MELTQIRYFLSVADELNYTKAAERNHISRQAMRQSLKALEAEIGTPLVVNSHNHLSLTGIGLSFATAFKPILAQLDEAQHEIMTMARSAGISVRMGYSPTFFPFILPNLMTDLHVMADALGFIDFHFDAEDASDLVRKLSSGELDMALFMSMPPHRYENVSVENIKSFRLGMTVRKEALAGRAVEDEAIELSDLADMGLVGVDNVSITMRPFADALRNRGLLEHYERVNDVFTAVKKVEQENRAFVEMWRTGEARFGSAFANYRLADFEFNLCLGWNNAVPHEAAEAVAAYMTHWQNALRQS